MTPPAKLRLLFVDDEPQVLKVLRLTLRAMTGEWEMAFVETGQQALALMAQQPVDVIVSDMRMPGMNGAQLLNEVMMRYPRTIRIILSAFADQDLVMRCIGATHQYLTKPCDLMVLRSALARIYGLTKRLEDPDLRSLISEIKSLPSIPQVYLRMIEALEVPDAPIDAVSDIIAEDPALTAKVLQLVNSAFFGFARPSANVREAVQLLGVGIIRALALTIHLFSAFTPAQLRELPVDEIWEHSLRTALLARQIAELEKSEPVFVEQAFSAGLLHDVGKLILVAHRSPDYLEALERARTCHVSLSQVEREIFKSTHADVGAYLIGIWGLPMALVEAVAYHHSPGQASAPSFSPLTAVHVANHLAYANHPTPSEPALYQLDMAYLTRIGVEGRLPVWQAAAKKH